MCVVACVHGLRCAAAPPPVLLFGAPPEQPPGLVVQEKQPISHNSKIALRPIKIGDVGTVKIKIKFLLPSERHQQNDNTRTRTRTRRRIRTTPEPHHTSHQNHTSLQIATTPQLHQEVPSGLIRSYDSNRTFLPGVIYAFCCSFRGGGGG